MLPHQTQACLRVLLFLTAIATTWVAVQGNCARRAGPECHVYCVVSEERPAGFIVLGVGAELGLDLLTIGWNFEVINETANRPYNISVDPTTGVVSLPQPVDFDTSPRPGIVGVVVRGTPVTTTTPQQPFVPQVGPLTTCSLQIETEDLDDNFPDVTDAYRVNVPVSENTQVGTVVAKFAVVDRDSGVFGQFSFIRILNGTGRNARILDPIIRGLGTFEVDNITGDVTLIAPLDAEGLPAYELAVTVLPAISHPGELFATFVINILVLDEDEFAPNVTIQPVQFGATLRPPLHAISESLQMPELIFLATASDADRTAEITFLVEGGMGDFTARTFNNLLHALESKPPLDRERIGIYNLTLVFYDSRGTPGVTPTTRINYTITVEDIDDNLPQFTPSMYRADMPETTAAGSTVVQFTASDPDFNDGVYYEIVETVTLNSSMSPVEIADVNVSTLFQLDQITGALTTTRTLDYEAVGAVTFSVLVLGISKLNSSRSSNATALIQLVDTNDETPIFEFPMYVFDIGEDAAVPSFVGRVTATDRDAGKNGDVLYSIRGLSTPDVTTMRFRIGELDGQIITTGSFDRETVGEYTFLAQATDDALNGSQRLQGAARVTVRITDVNDNPPRFFNPPTVVMVPQELARGAAVYQFSVTDADATLSPVIYTVIAQKQSQTGIISSHFRITSGGTLQTTRSLATLTPDVYTIIVTAVDANRTVFDDVKTVQLNVTARQMEAQKSSSVDLALITGAIAGGTVFIILLAVLIVFCHIRIKKKRMLDTSNSKPKKSALVFQNNLYDTDFIKSGKDVMFSRPGTLPIGASKLGSGNGLVQTPRSDPDGSAFTPGSFNEQRFMDRSRNRTGIYEPHSGSERATNSRESYTNDWDRRMSVRTSSSLVDEVDTFGSGSSTGQQSGGLAAIDPSPTVSNGGSVLSATQSRHVSYSAEPSYKPRPGQDYASKSALHMRSNEAPHSPRSAASTHSQSTHYSATPPSSAQGVEQLNWQPLCFKPPVATATPGITSPLATDISNGSTPSTSYRTSPPSRQYSYTSGQALNTAAIEIPHSGEDASEGDDVQFYPAGLRRPRVGSSSQNSSHSGSGLQDDQRYSVTDSRLQGSIPGVVVEIRESDVL